MLLQRDGAHKSWWVSKKVGQMMYLNVYRFKFVYANIIYFKYTDSASTLIVYLYNHFWVKNTKINTHKNLQNNIKIKIEFFRYMCLCGFGCYFSSTNCTLTCLHSSTTTKHSYISLLLIQPNIISQNSLPYKQGSYTNTHTNIHASSQRIAEIYIHIYKYYPRNVRQFSINYFQNVFYDFLNDWMSRMMCI